MLTHSLHASMLAMPAIFMAAFFSGCNSYQFGNPAELAFESIYVQPVTNDSFAPQAQAILSTQIRDAFIRDGRTKLVTSREAADAVLIVNLTEYNRRAAARQSVDTTVAASFSLYSPSKSPSSIKTRANITSKSAQSKNLPSLTRKTHTPLRSQPDTRFPTIGIPSHASPHPRPSASNCRRGAQPMGT